MKIISYNVNGIRAALKKGFIDWLKSADPDVICLQEIKAQEDQLDLSVFEDAGYAYNYWFSAQKKGYSGVAILSKTEPTNRCLELALSLWILKVAIFVQILMESQ